MNRTDWMGFSAYHGVPRILVYASVSITLLRVSVREGLRLLPSDQLSPTETHVMLVLDAPHQVGVPRAFLDRLGYLRSKTCDLVFNETFDGSTGLVFPRGDQSISLLVGQVRCHGHGAHVLRELLLGPMNRVLKESSHRDPT